ncbi:uncharacterized protein VK521_017768 isoform 1-T1 [Ammospiza maritima maritima]
MAARTEPGAAPAASAGRGSRRGLMIEVGSGPGPDRHRYRRRFPGAAPGSRLETGRAGESPVAAPGPPGPRRPLSAAALPAGRPLADTAPLLSPAGTPSPARQRRGHRAPLYRDTALPCESHSARIPPLRVRILGGSPPNDRGWGRCSRCGCARCGPGGGQKPPKRWQPSRPLGSAGGAVPAACRTHVPVWAPGYRDSAGTDTAEALPVAPQPGAALNRHTEIPQPGQTPPTAQKDPKEQRALPGVEARTVCRGAHTAVPVSDLPELPHSSQILNPKQYTWEMPQNQRFKRDEVWNFPGSQLKCRSEGKLWQCPGDTREVPLPFSCPSPALAAPLLALSAPVPHSGAQKGKGVINSINSAIN